MSAAIALQGATPGRAVPRGRDGVVDFALFARSMRSPASVTDALASPGLADVWVEAIVAAWKAWHDAGRLDPVQPLYLLDLAPDSGYFAWLMLRALHERLERGDSPPWSVRYLACMAPDVARAGWLDHAGLAADPHVDTLAWEPSRAGASIPRSARRGYRWNATGNPPVVLALGYLQRFPGLLLAVNDGRLLEGEARVVAEDAATCELEYDWQAASARSEAAFPALLRQRYLRSLSSACVRLPHEGLRALRHIADLTRGQFLWLAADRGVTSERPIRLGALAPPLTWQRASDALAVDFHALAYEQTAQGAWSRHWQREDVGVAVQAIWRHDGVQLPCGHERALEHHLAAFHPDDAAQYVRLASALAAEAEPSLRLALLRASGHAPDVLRGVLSVWADTPPALGEVERAGWHEAVARVWERCPRTDEHVALRHDLAVFAAHLGRLDLARGMFAYDSDHTCLAWCEALGGNLGCALDRLRRSDPRDDHARALREELQARRTHWQTLTWYRAELAVDGDLALEPLGAEHAQAMLRQYRDPEIGMLTRLPQIDSHRAACDWIAEQEREPGRATCAVMHADAGFVGVVSMQCSGDCGYFYFWIGCDHQGCGYGRRAGRLLQAQAAGCGVRRLFTSVYPDNRRSRDALAELGFVPLAATAVPPDDDLVFLVSTLSGGGREPGAGDVAMQLANFLSATQSPIRIDPRSRAFGAGRAWPVEGAAGMADA
ncbi:MAG: GNAT family N-acetyltransferase [Xanthomonadaceae bacterium]|nr:GNAT family N-acetyltransferase [Xanthomonadaceae bacterium]